MFQEIERQNVEVTECYRYNNKYLIPVYCLVNEVVVANFSWNYLEIEKCVMTVGQCSMPSSST